jgi:CDP-6-deoxy-D-xylo-4-hexulose-3-dehydrase
MGFNLKPLDPQAAIGRVQLRKLMGFIEARKQNWEYLRRGLDGLSEFFDFALSTHASAWLPPRGEDRNVDAHDDQSLPSPVSGFDWDDTQCRTDCSWFGFKITLKETAPFSKTELVRYLDEHKIGNRMLFGGNLVRQPAFVRLRAERPEAFRVIGDLPVADRIMNRTFFLGTYPGLTEEMMDYEIDVITRFCSK